MKNFKNMQQVVYTTKNLIMPLDFYRKLHPAGIWPTENEIVTIYRAYDEVNWILIEYPMNANKKLQVFHERVLFPLDQVHTEYTENLLLDLQKKIHPINV